MWRLADILFALVVSAFVFLLGISVQAALDSVQMKQMRETIKAYDDQAKANQRKLEKICGIEPQLPPYCQNLE